MREVHRINKVIHSATKIVFGIICILFICANKERVYAEEQGTEKLNISVDPASDNTKVTRVGDGYFINGEAILKVQDGLAPDITNKLILVSQYDGDEFSEYKEVENGVVKLTPNRNTGYDFKAVKVKEIAVPEDGLISYTFESDIICINYDNVAPAIIGDANVDLSRAVTEGTKYVIKISDDGGIGSIRLNNHGENIDTIELCKPDGNRITEYEYTLTLNASNSRSNILVEVVDLAGNTSEFGFDYVVDNGAPSVSISGIENGKIYNKAAGFRIDVADNMQELYSYYKCSFTGIDGVTKTIEESLSKIEESTFSISKYYSEEGIYDVEFYAKDSLGNITDTYYVSFGIDSKAPLVQIANIENGKIYKSGVDVYCVVSDMFYTGVEVAVSASRMGNSITLSPFNMAAKTSKAIYRFIEDGEYRISVSAKDQQGNECREDAYFIVDTIAPEITVTNDSGIVDGSAFITKAPEFNVKVAGEGSGVNATATLYRIGQGGIYEKISEKIFIDTKNDIMCPFSIEDDGEYILNAVAYDKAGNESIRTIEFTLDKNPPVIGYIDAFNEKFLKAFTLPENLKDYIKDTTAVKYRAYLNEEEIRFGDVTGDGRYLLQITAMDEAGNTSESMAAFIVDSTAPKIVVSGIRKSNDQATVNKGDVINVSLLDKDDWFEKVTVNGIEVSVNAMKKTLDFRVDNFGEYNVEILARDYAGNETTEVINTKCLLSGIDPTENISIKTLTKNEAKNREIFSRKMPTLKFYVFCGFIFATSVIFVVFALFDIKKIKC